MPGLDHSDYIAFNRVVGTPEPTVADMSTRMIADLRTEIAECQARIDAANPEWFDFVKSSNSVAIARRVKLIERLQSPDPWAYWEPLADFSLYGCGAWANQGYWQGFLPDRASRAPLVRRQWDGEDIEASLVSLGFPRLREKLAAWAMARWWKQVGHYYLGGRLPRHLMTSHDIDTSAWWATNLSNIAWGGGCGQAQGSQEAAIFDLRRLGFSWERACRLVHHDEWHAVAIARYLEFTERKGFVIGYGPSLERMPWPPVTIGCEATASPEITPLPARSNAGRCVS